MRKITYISILSLILFLNCTNKQDVKQDSKNNVSGNQSSTNNTSGNKTGDVSKSKKSDKDEITIPTSDSKNLSANYFYLSDQKETPQPLVILIHQFMQNKEQWKQDYIDLLLDAGYKVLAYDIRGHGKSSKVSYNLQVLLSDPNEAPNDVNAVFGWAKSQKGIDTSRIAAIGTSIGGNLACYAKSKLGAKTVIAISNSKDGFESYLGINEASMGAVMLRIPSIFIICGSKDDEHAAGSKYMMDNFIGDPKELKIYDSDKHGMYLMEQFPEIEILTLNWLKKYL